MEYEWREQQRSHEIEKARLSTENQKLVREAKEAARKMVEEEAKVASLNEKLEKEKKNSKNWQ